MDITMEQETKSFKELLQGAVIHWPSLPDIDMKTELTDEEIREIRNSLTQPTTQFWSYIDFARAVIKAHDEKKNNGK